MRVPIGRTSNIEPIDWQLADIHLEFKRSESPVLFQETPPIPSDALKSIYTYANIKQSEMIFLSFYKRGDLWLLEESYDE